MLTNDGVKMLTVIVIGFARENISRLDFKRPDTKI